MGAREDSIALGNYVNVTGVASVAIGLGQVYGIIVDPSDLPELADDRTFAVMGGKMKICNDDNVCIDDLQSELQSVKALNAELLQRLVALENKLN